MKLATKLLTATLFIFIINNCFAQNISNKGKDFWVAYGYHQYMGLGTTPPNDQNMTIYISVEDLPAGKSFATVTIEADSSDPNPNLWWKRTYHINANTVISVNNTNAFSFSPASALGIGPIPKGATDAAASGTPPTWDFRLYNANGCPNPINPLGFGLFTGRGLHIKSDVDIVAYAHIYGGVSSGATMLLPTSSWGYSYTTINSNQNNADEGNNFFFIIAQEDSTVVKITPSQQPIQLACVTATPLVPYTITLQKGHIYQYRGYLNNTTQIGVQLTGSKIESIPNAGGKCKKIAVFAGSGRTGGESGTGCANSSRDNDMQQCFPEHTWGTKYLSAPFATSAGGINACGTAGSVYKIVAKDTGTYVSINGGTPTLIPSFGFVSFSSNAPCKFEGNKAIAVAQFMTSGNCNTGDGDPEMIYLSPVDQAIPKVGFYRNDKEAIDENFVSIIIPDSGMASLKINGAGFTGNAATNFGGNACVKVHPQDTRYKIVVKGWTAAAAQVLVSSDARFNTITYGLGGAESYGYSGGTYLNNLAAKPVIDNTADTVTKNSPKDANYTYTFDRTPLELRTSITYPPKRLDWLFSQLAKDATLMDTSKITLQRVCDSVKFQDIVDTQRGYFYTPPFQFTGNDTFYVQGCSSSGLCTSQMHVVTVGCPLTADISTKYIIKASGVPPYAGNVATDMAATCGKSPYKYTYVDGNGNPKATSNKGGTLSPANIPVSGAFNYIPPTPAASFNGKDTFYIRLCDNGGISPTTCFIKMYVVTIGTQFSIDTVVILNGAAQNTAVVNNHVTEFNAAGGKTPYTYIAVDVNGVPNPSTAAGGNVLIVSPNYTYTPATGFTGKDSFYIRVCDNNTPNSCAIQKHVVTVGLPFTANTANVINNTTVNTPYRGQASVFSNLSGGVGAYTYSIVNGGGGSTTTSNKGCGIAIKPSNGLFTYTPTTGLTGVDTFYIKVCDASTPTTNCSTQMFIVNINPAFTGNTAVVSHNVNNASTVTGTANTEINPMGGTTPYNYDIVNSLYKPSGGLSGRGGTVTVTGFGYTYTPPANYIGKDTFYVRVQDASTTANSIVQMHLVSVFPSIIGNSLPFYHVIAGDKNLSGNLLVEMPGLPKTSLTNFIPVTSNGNYKDSSTRKGLISMIPLPIDTTHDPVQGDRYIYKALPTYIPACDYMFVKKDTINDRIDTVYVPIVIYSKPVNGLPTGCYGAGGLVGDTIKLPYVIYPNPRIYRKSLVTTPSCPTDSIITFTGVDSSIKTTVGAKTIIYPAIRWIWKVSGTYKAAPVNYLDTAKTTSHAFDTGTRVCVSLTTIFTNGATNYFDSCFDFITSKVKFGVFPARLCLGQSIKVLDSTYSRTGIDSIYWDFGDGKFVTYSKGFDTNYVYKDTGTFTIRHTVKVKGCGAAIDTISQKIYVAAKRFPVIVSPLNCIDTSGAADFWYDSSGGGVPIKNYRWFFGDAASGAADSSHINPTTHTYPNENNYIVKLFVEDTSGCKGDTTTTVKIHILPNIYFKPFATGICANANPISIKDSAGCLNKQRVLGYGKFRGPGITDTLGTFDPSKANTGVNTIWYIYTSGSGACVDSVAQQITVWAKPTVAYDYSPKTCLPKSGIASFSNQSSNAFSFLWDFDDAANTYYSNNPSIVDSVHSTHKFFNTGNHNVKLVATSVEGCKDSVIKAIVFSVTPAANYPAFPSAGICENQTNYPINTATITNGISLLSGNYYGNGVSTTGSLSPAVSGYGNDSLTYIATSTGGCADTAIQFILVKARPRIGFTYPAGCLPANGIVQFTDTSKIPDGQTVQSCAWTFGDPGSGALNTSNNCNASHTYNYGTYTIYHSVTSSLGCVTDTTFNATFSISPSLYYNTITASPVCQNITSVSVATAGSNNLSAAPGSGEYHGNGITNVATGDFNPSIASAGTHTIWYVFSASSGCKDSVSETITVLSKPAGMFVYTPTSACLDTTGLVQFDASAVTVAGSTIQSYNWDFGNGTGTGVNPTNNFNDGSYNIKLKATAANTCVLDTSLNAVFHKTPHLDSITLAYICTNGGTTNVAAPAVLNGVKGTGVFSSFKNAITTTGVYDPAISGFGTDTIYYKFTSDSGCVATSQFAATIKSRPTGTFTYTPTTGCLNTSGTVQFDASSFTAPGSSVSGYTWDYGDATLPLGTGVTTSHNYNDGTFTIKLKVDASNGCYFDTSLSATFSKTPLLDTIPKIDVCENGGTVTLTAPKVLNGAVGTGVFSSFKGAATAAGVYDPSKAGYGIDTIYYTFTNAGGCSATQLATIYVKARPYGTFSFVPNTGCLDVSGKVTFTSNVTVPNSSVSNDIWDFGDGSPNGTGGIVSHNYTDGTYTIKLTATGTNTCSFDTSLTTRFNKTPLLDNLIQSPICENGGLITLTAPAVLNGVAGTGVFSSTKGAATVTGLYDPSIAAYGNDNVTYTFTSGAGCTATKTTIVRVLARPRGTFSFTPNTGCLDASGLVKFNSSAINVPGSYPKTFTWDFEAPSSPTTGANPTHNYNDGTFDIKLNVLGNNTCSFDTMITQKFSRTPSLDPIVVANVCANSSPFMLTAPNVNNGVAGPSGVFGSYRNAVTGNTATGFTYTPVVGSYIIDTIYYNFTSNNGCSTIGKKVININPVPQIKLKAAGDICKDTVTIFRDMSTIKSGHIDSTWWYFYDSTYVNPIGGIINRSFDSAATYSIYYTAKSDSGCVTNDSIKITARPQPVALFEIGSVVCMPKGTVYFTNKSTLGATGGTMGYNWNFGDPTGSTATNPNTAFTIDAKHTYTTIANYPVRLTVGSKEYGCYSIYDDTLKVQHPFYLKPIADFDVTKDTLCMGEFATFIDTKSTAPGSQIFSWTWNYGDGSTPNTTIVPTASYAYGASGVYDVLLTLRNIELCESEPAHKTVVVYKTPHIDSIPVIYAVDGSIVQFKPRVTDTLNTSYWWAAPAPYGVAGLSNSNVLKPYLNVTQYPPYNVSNPSQVYTLYAMGNANNCVDSANQVVKILGKISVPNAFSPNGDGINDTWKITSLGDYPGATLDIYDRYGLKVTHLSGANMIWDGTINGTPAPVATYYYVIDPGNNVPLITGWVVLLR